MAAIDKTYGTKDESAQTFNWLRRHRPKFLRYHYGVNSFNHLADHYERPILNTRVSADKWLARYCPLPFVLARIVEVYGEQAVARKWAESRLAMMEQPK